MAAAGDETNLDAPRITFDDFYKAYPRRVARKDAEKAWGKIDPSLHNRIIEAIKLAKKTDDWRKEGGKFIPYPASYLRGERWDDELEADLSMGQCHWNINGNRGPELRCEDKATTEKNNVPYCRTHAERV